MWGGIAAKSMAGGQIRPPLDSNSATEGQNRPAPRAARAGRNEDRSRRPSRKDEAANCGGPDCNYCRLFRSRRSPAANASATTVAARTDPTAGTATGTGISATGRQCDDRGCVLERKDAGGSPLALRAGLQGHGSQHERCCGQSQRKFSHQPSSLFAGLLKI